MDTLTGLSLGNNLLCEKQGKTAYNTPNWWDLFPDPMYARALVHWFAIFFSLFRIHREMLVLLLYYTNSKSMLNTKTICATILLKHLINDWYILDKDAILASIPSYEEPYIKVPEVVNVDYCLVP
ncbi:hypothetical protein MTR_1g095940 [Medicago truncatula]|uniref:Uncharacterized protein n=1 Tax=Medicago truncatula TaxID=3880 RepID=G7I9N9_MEDTR|nr:hypothetical protein MTR_1g095940 [Medicago truncatula]